MRPIRPEDVARMPWHAVERAKAELERECQAAAARNRAILLARADPARILAQLPAEDPEVVARRRHDLAEARPVPTTPITNVSTGPGCAPACTLPRRTPGSPWCGGHYLRWRKYGDVLAHIPLTRANSGGLDRTAAA